MKTTTDRCTGCSCLVWCLATKPLWIVEESYFIFMYRCKRCRQILIQIRDKEIDQITGEEILIGDEEYMSRNLTAPPCLVPYHGVTDGKLICEDCCERKP